MFFDLVFLDLMIRFCSLVLMFFSLLVLSRTIRRSGLSFLGLCACSLKVRKQVNVLSSSKSSGDVFKRLNIPIISGKLLFYGGRRQNEKPCNPGTFQVLLN